MVENNAEKISTEVITEHLKKILNEIANFKVPLNL